MATDLAEFRAFMTNFAILPEVQDIVIERGVESVRVFANAVVSREHDVGETLLKGSAWASHIGQLGAIRMAWREADVREEGVLHPTATSSSTGPPEEIEAPLTQATQRELETVFLSFYSFLRIPADRIVSDALLGRFKREFDRRQPSVLPLRLIKTRARTSYSLGPKRRKVSEHATLIFHDNHDEDTFQATSVFEFFTSLEILVYSWSVAGCFDVDWGQAKVKYFHFSHGQDYLWSMKERFMDLAPGYAEASLLRYLECVEEDFRGRAIEIARENGGSCPFGVALLRSQSDLQGTWERRQGLLALQRREVGKVPQTRDRKGNGKGKRGKTNVKVATEVPQSGALQDVKPLRLREPERRPVSGDHDRRDKWATCTHLDRKNICKAWNDGRGCKTPCVRRFVHACDIRLAEGRACGSKDHRRVDHDPRRHGQPQERL